MYTNSDCKLLEEYYNPRIAKVYPPKTVITMDVMGYTQKYIF